jgi:hypothetical protein
LKIKIRAEERESVIKRTLSEITYFEFPAITSTGTLTKNNKYHEKKTISLEKWLSWLIYKPRR